MCISSNDTYVLRHDVIGLQVLFETTFVLIPSFMQAKKFEKLGQLMAMSLSQSGSGFPFFASCMFDYICGKDVNEVTVDINNVPDYEARDLLFKVLIANSYSNNVC